VLAFLTCLLFFSLSGCKRPAYILPAFPTLALVLGTYASRAFPWRYWLARVRPRLCPRLSWLCHSLGTWATIASVQMGLVAGWLAVVGRLWTWPAALACTLAGDGLCLLLLVRGQPRRAWASWVLCALTTAGVLLVTFHALLPDYHRKFGLRGQVRRHRELAREMPVACYPKRWDSVSFYLQRDVVVYGPERRRELVADLQSGQGTLLFVKNGRDFEEVRQALPRGWEFVPRGRQGWNVVAGVVQREGFKN
jgi:hypothetical protein